MSCKKCDAYDQHTEHEYEISKIREEREEKDENIQCKECDHEPFLNFRSRVKHYRLEHKDKNIYNCDDCQYGSNYLPNLKTHINSKHLKKVLKCPKCPFESTWKPRYLSHMREKHKQFQKVSKNFPNGKSVLCEECGESTNSNDLLKNHQCNGVPKLPRRRLRTDTINNLLIEVGKYKCNKCDFTTDHPSNVRTHYALIHQNQKPHEKFADLKPSLNEELKFHCRKCDFHTSIAFDLKNHLANH